MTTFRSSQSKASVSTPTTTILLQIILTLLAILTVCEASVSRCPENFYLSSETHDCQACSTCPKNQIARKPCGKYSNTLCGPFIEFSGFHQAPRHSVDVGDLPLTDDGGGGGGVGAGEGGDDTDQKIKDLIEDIDSDIADNHHHNHQHPHKKHFRNPSHKGENQREGRRGKGEHSSYQDGRYDDVFSDVTGPRQVENPGYPDQHQDGVLPKSKSRLQDNQVPSLQNPDEGENQWKVLALALIVVLCVVCIFLIIFVLIVCYMRSRRSHLKKVLYSADHSAAARALSRPSQSPSLRYVPVLTNAQGRAGTSGGSDGIVRAPPCGMVDSSFLYSEDYDADNSGQTISTTKSSDYVYFKTPQNGHSVYDV